MKRINHWKAKCIIFGLVKECISYTTMSRQIEDGTARRNHLLLDFSFKTTLVSTTLTAIAPLITTLVDGLCTGNLLGTDAFNAVNTVMPLVNAVSVLTLICNMGGSVLAAKQLASGNRDQANRIFTISLTSAVAVALVAIMTIALNLNGISRFLCPGENGAAQVRIYLGIMLAYFLFVPFCTTMNNFISVEGHPELVTRSVIISNSVNVILDIVFIAVFNWGIAGAAWSTVISGITNLAIYIPHFLKGKSSYRFNSRAFDTTFWSMLGQNLKQGFGFNIFYIVINLFVLFCNTLISHSLGALALSQFGLCIQVESVTFGLVVGICIAGISHICRMQGESDNEGIRFVMERCIRMTLVFFSILALVMALFPQLILVCFGMNTPEMSDSCRMPFACFGVFYLCFAFLAVYSTVVMQLMGHVEGKIVIIFGTGILTALNMMAWSAVSAQKLWLGFVTGSIPMVIGALLYAYGFHRRNKGVMRFLMLDTTTVNVRFDYSMDFKLTKMESMMHDLNVFTEVCQIPKKIIDHIQYCCIELCASVGEKRLRRNISSFDLSFIETDKVFRLIIKDNGTPDNPLEFDADMTQNIQKPDYVPSERDTRLYLVNKLSDRVDYSYVFGMNITVLEWDKA